MAECHFCGGNDTPIHPESDTQYGEPVCSTCFKDSYIPDPDVFESQEAMDRSLHMAEFQVGQKYARQRQF